MVSVREINEAEVAVILSSNEGHYLDFKSTDIKPSKMSESLSSFANTSGGELYIGIGEDKSDLNKPKFWSGFADFEAANSHCQIVHELFPLEADITTEFLTSSKQPGYVLHIVVAKSRSIVKSTGGDIYIRINALNHRLKSDDEVKRLELDKGVVTYEDEVVPIPIDTVTNSLTIIGFLLTVAQSAEPYTWLQSQFLINNDKPTVACTLLFSDCPQAALPKRSAIKIFRYRSKEDDGSRETLAFDPITIEGSLYDLIKTAVEKTKVLVEDIKKLGVSGLEEVQYPEETLHEIVTNAVLHRDYSIATDTQIRIYDNRIEVESPGRLPGHVTTKNFLETQFARNPKIVRLINKFPDAPNKDVGEGLNTAFSAMTRLRLKEPDLIETDNSVLVKISHTPLASPEDMVMDYLNSHDEISNGIARDLTGIRSENTMKEAFYRLAKRGLIERVPDKQGSASAWRKATGDAANTDPTPTSSLFDMEID